MQEKRSDYVTKTCDEFERMSTRPPQFGPKSRCFQSLRINLRIVSSIQGMGASQAGFRLSASGLIKLLARRWCRRAESRSCHLVVKLRGTRFCSSSSFSAFSFSFSFSCFDGLIIVATVSCRASANFSRPNRESRIVGENPKTRGGFLINLGETGFRLVSLPAEISLDWLPFQRGNWS